MYRERCTYVHRMSTSTYRSTYTSTYIHDLQNRDTPKLRPPAAKPRPQILDYCLQRLMLPIMLKYMGCLDQVNLCCFEVASPVEPHREEAGLMC